MSLRETAFAASVGSPQTVLNIINNNEKDKNDEVVEKKKRVPWNRIFSDNDYDIINGFILACHLLHFHTYTVVVVCFIYWRFHIYPHSYTISRICKRGHMSLHKTKITNAYEFSKNSKKEISDFIKSIGLLGVPACRITWKDKMSVLMRPNVATTREWAPKNVYESQSIV